LGASKVLPLNKEKKKQSERERKRGNAPRPSYGWLFFFG